MILFDLGKNHKTREICRSVQLQVFKRLYWKFPSFFSVPSTPDAIELELTNNCNLSCPHCHGRRQKIPIGARPIGEMSYELFKKLVDEIHTYPFCKLLFCGLGEPAMHSNIAQFLDYLRPFHHKFCLVTNGLLLDRFPPEQILDWNIDSLTISVDGFDEDTYHQHRPGGNYQQLKANVQGLYEARSKRKSRYPRMNISNILFPDQMNHSNVESFRNDWIRFSDTVNFTTLMPFERKTYKVVNQCSHTFFDINVRWNGLIPVCAFHSMEFVGDANHSTIKEIFNGKEKRNLQECHRRKAFDKVEYCKTCIVCQDRERIASSHGNNLNKSKLLTAANFVYRKFNLGLRD